MVSPPSLAFLSPSLFEIPELLVTFLTKKNKENATGNQGAHWEVSIDFLTHLTQTGGEDVFGFLRSPAVYCEAIRDVCIEAVGREFYGQFTRARRMQKLVYCVERLVSLNETEVAMNNFEYHWAAFKIIRMVAFHNIRSPFGGISS